MENTKIAWATHTFSPWIGCSQIASGCDNCYAAAMAGRLGVVWGQDGTRRRTAEATWKQVEKWNQRAACCCSRLASDDLGLQVQAELHFRGCPQSDRPRVFPSLCDPFEDWPGVVLGPVGARWKLDDVRRDFFAMIDRCQNLDFLLLTKRPENIRRMWLGQAVTSSLGRDVKFDPVRHNAWLLYSASDHDSLWRGYGNIQACRDLAPIWGLSLEPLLGPINLYLSEIDADYRPQWVIVGGESGPRARPCDVEWIRSIVQQCADAGVPCFVKQLGAYPAVDVLEQQDNGHVWRLDSIKDPKGADPSEWPEDLRVQQFPGAQPIGGQPSEVLKTVDTGCGYRVANAT